MQAQDVMQQALMVRKLLSKENIMRNFLQEINSFPKETIGAAELEEIISRLGNLLSNTNWMVLEIQQKLLNFYMKTQLADRPT